MSWAKSWDLKLRTYALWTPHKEHTKSAISKDHLAPCRFNYWTNQISIGISQPLAQLQCRYNVEIPRVSLPNDRAKWDFRTDRIRYQKNCWILSIPIWNPVHLVHWQDSTRWWYHDVLVRASMYLSGYKAVWETSKWYIPVRTNIENSYGSTYWYVLICTALYLHSTRWYKVVQDGTRWYKVVQTTVY